MSELVRMTRQFESMNVLPEKVAAFLAEGWTEVERVPMTGDIPKAKAPTKPRGKSTGKAEDVEPVEPEPEGEVEDE